MLIRPLLLTILVLLLSHFVKAQGPILEVDESFTLSLLKSKELGIFFNEGEKILLDLTILKGNNLSKVEVINSRGEVVYIKKGVKAINNHLIDVKKSAEYRFIVKNWSIFSKSYTLKIRRLPIPVYEDVIARDTLVSDTIIVMDTVRTVFRDTIFENMIQEQFYIGSLLNINDGNTLCRRIDYALDTNQIACYWVSTSLEITDAYAAFKDEDPPPKWFSETVKEPIIAYGLGLLDTLMVDSLDGRIHFGFTDTLGMKAYQKKSPYLPLKQEFSFYGSMLPSKPKAEDGKITVCFTNQNKISGVPILLKIARFRIEETVDEQIFERLQVKEFYRSTKVQTN